MDLGDPTRSIVPTLDGPVLAVLARSGRPLTVGEVTAQTARGSEIGVRRCLARLVGQGIVLATEMGRNRVHELNQDHVAAPIAIALSDLRVELWNRMRKELNSWRPKTLYACVFGSVARGDGGTESDIDLLIIHPPFPGDPKPPRRSSLLESVAAAIAAPVPASPTEAKRWPRYIDQLRDSVQKWSGNVLQVVDLSFAEWVGMQQSSELGQEIKRDSIELIGKLKL